MKGGVWRVEMPTIGSTKHAGLNECAKFVDTTVS